MWKRNVAHLRRCSSAFAQHAFALRGSEPSRHARDAIGASHDLLWRSTHTQDGPVKAEGAIRTDEFLAALSKVLPLGDDQPHTVGIAVSGGVDSMALATLYAKCEGSQLPKLHGFIIDHKARPGSTEEAHWVAEQLSSLGFQSTIIPLIWSERFDLSHKSRFESVARTLRYQALGTACREMDIKSLLLGHHADDQAETIMMRLMTDRIRSGLQGMSPIEWIPECRGMHSVSHSGNPASEKDSLSSLFEHGGIQLLRPLLEFQKSRLIATCETHNTRWAEDKTNQDRTLTARNAIRHIFSNHKLPVILSKESMLAVAQKTRSRVDKYKAAADKLFDSCSIKLDIQTASLVVRLPPVEALLTNPTPTPPSSEKLQARNTAHYLLQRVVELVSPREHMVHESLANAVLAIYPSLASGGLQEGVRPARVFNSNWCLWTINTSAVDCTVKDGVFGQTDEWCISRQPPKSEAFESSSLHFPPMQTSGWQLFDGRFWVRVHNLTDRPIIMRMLTDTQLEHLNPLDPAAKMFNRRKQMRAILDTITPHALRRHLPALFLAPVNKEQEPTLIALPTLQSSPTLSRDDQSPWECTWEVRYKKVDPGARTLSDIVRKPVYHSVEFDPLNPLGMDAPQTSRRKKNLKDQKGDSRRSGPKCTPTGSDRPGSAQRSRKLSDIVRKPVYHSVKSGPLTSWGWTQRSL